MVGEEQEPDNAVNKFAMKVVKNNERFLVCWCLVVRVKQKLIAWKNSWRARFADKHLKTQTAPLGATDLWKSQWTTATHSQFLKFLGILRSFMNINEVFEHSKHRLYMDVYGILNLNIMVWQNKKIPLKAS